MQEEGKTPLDDGVEQRHQHISVLSAFMMLTTWSTSSSNVLYPFCFGVLGTVGGPLLMLTTFYISWTATRWTVEAALQTGADTFGALGLALAGTKGRILFEGTQILNQQLFLPVAIVLCSGAVQSLLDAKGHMTHENGLGDTSFAACNGNMVLLFALVAFALIQLSREFENVSAIAYVSCGLMVAMTVTIAEEVMTRDPPASITKGASELVVGMGEHSTRYHWANILNAVGIFERSFYYYYQNLGACRQLTPTACADLGGTCPKRLIGSFPLAALGSVVAPRCSSARSDKKKPRCSRL